MLILSSRVDAMNRLGRAMADPTRSRILLSLLEGPGYPGELAEKLGLTRSNVSNHLACLRGCGIVVAEMEGRRTRYEISDPHLARALRELVEVTLAVEVDGSCTDGCAADSCIPDDGVADGCVAEMPVERPVR
ncbi:MAG: metalloregulator ArsR/SmtB family transcription factor [Acidipropionibacterium sp.]|jgi:DNA-binding transcriptional ArsR family regulator|nr:metalloregulator ArsR/SmtB family transcription factor [Acidipropionibacterium sp.]